MDSISYLHPMRNLPIAFILVVALAFVSCNQGSKPDFIIRNATIMDGSGTEGRIGDVSIRGDRILEVSGAGTLSADSIIDGTGMILAPGFIDAHSHHDDGLEHDPSGLPLVSQGITTIVVGQDGGSQTPLGRYFHRLEKHPVAVNVASYSGHNSIRDSIMGKDFKRKATEAEIKRMKDLLRWDMEAGALGLSTGLEYDPGIYSAAEEVLELSRMLPKYHGRYISHLRSEDRYFHKAIDEIITIGKEAGIPVQISHFKLAMRGLWGQADAVLRKLDSARAAGVDITADWYPYAYWSSTIRVLFPDRNFSDKKEAEFILSSVTTPEGIIFSHYEPESSYDGKSLADVAKALNMTPADALLHLIRVMDDCDEKGGDCSGSIVATSMSEEDMDLLLKWPHTVICSDGSSSGRHPRGFGAFTRILGHYVRERSVIGMPEAIRKMTAQTADQLGITDRGRIKAGQYADLVLFDPQNVTDKSTISNPQMVSEGIIRVWVNGKEVFESGETSGVLPGKVIRRTTKAGH